MWKNYPKEVRSIYWALRAQVCLLTKGESPVSSTCQIADIRKKYLALGLSSDQGVFVEIGAFDGESASNTSFLADQGWRGVYVEPIPLHFHRMKLRHAFNNVRGENVGITDASGSAQIRVMEGLSTMNEATAEHYRGVSWSSDLVRTAKLVTVMTERLDVVLARNAIPPDFDLMVVDVEGGEETIIKSLLSSPWRPRVLIIELCDLHPDFASNAELTDSASRVRDSLIMAGYRERFADPINTIFVHTDPGDTAQSANGAARMGPSSSTSNAE